MGKTIELHIPSVPGSEKTAMERAASAAREMGFSEDRVEDLKTAISEACLNAIEHGNRFDASTKVAVILTMRKASLQVEVHDQGKGIGEISAPDIDKKVEGGEKTRGWGIFLIRSLMDDVTFEAAPEGGNVVRMVIHLEKQPR